MTHIWLAKDAGRKFDLVSRDNRDTEETIATVYRNGSWLVRKDGVMIRSGTLATVESAKRMALSIARGKGLVQ
jgi:hypothetical protein